MSLLRLDGVHLRYPNGTQALAGVTLDVPAGDFVTLLGPSGCGKSSVLRLVAGLEQATAGQVRRPGDGGVGFVFQAPTLLPWATVADNVRLPLRLRGGGTGPQAQAAIDAVLAQVGLAGFASAYPEELSGGMQMRVSLARALVTRPSVLLLDEPFAALDDLTRQALGDQLRALWQQQGLTVLFVTHNVFEAVALSERVLVMGPRPGRLVAELAIEGPPERGLAFRHSADYAAQCVRVSQALHAATAALPEGVR